MSKKIKIGILVLVCLFFFIGNANANRSVNDAVNWAENQVGATNDNCEYNHLWEYMCMHFCGHVYDVVPSGIHNAVAGWGSSGDSVFGPRSTSSNIPVGALMFYGTGLYDPDGHVGIYVGNGQIIHAWTDGIRKDNINDSKFTDYKGWRWPNAWTSDTVFRQVGDVAWSPANKSCINAENWVRMSNGEAIQTLTRTACYGLECINLTHI